VSTQSPPHEVWPVAQLAWQTPLTQTCKPGHTVPHAPQFERSVCTSRQAPAQNTWPPPQVGAHTPPEHTSSVAQVVPQAPQLARSVWRSRHTLLQRLRRAFCTKPGPRRQYGRAGRERRGHE
jgi:hypothetical protein